MDIASLYSVRSKKLGVMMRSVRTSHQKSAEECAAAMGVALDDYNSFERGDQSPSLPQLELLAYFLKISLDTFWMNEIPTDKEHKLELSNLSALLNLRNRVVGAMLRKRRIERGFSVSELAEKTGISEEQLTEYENGRTDVPIPVLEGISEALAWTISAFQDDRGPVGTFFVQERSARGFKELSPSLQKFVVQPVNLPYLELAQRLSEMDVTKLRNVAEGLLEITL